MELFNVKSPNLHKQSLRDVERNDTWHTAMFCDPKSCRIGIPDVNVSENTLKDDCMASYSANGKLHIPCVSVLDVFGGITIYDIKMNQQTKAFIFDLDMDSVKPR